MNATSTTERKPADFDRIARHYRWLEYVTLGTALQRCRMAWLPSLLNQRNALVLGDGDGRFLAGLLRANANVQAIAFDSSATMLRLLAERCRPYADRLQTVQLDATGPGLNGAMRGERYDVVCTHFFLDCLSQEEVVRLVRCVAAHLEPQALWVVSEFRLPHGLMRLPGRLMVGFLYRTFGLLTGLRARSLPDHHAALSGAGLRLVAERRWLGGLLVSELWRRASASNAT